MALGGRWSASSSPSTTRSGPSRRSSTSCSSSTCASRSCWSTTAPRTARPPELARLAATHAQVTVLSQPRNLGKGAAVRRGIDDSHGDILLIQDADLEYSPSDIPALIAPLLTGKADAVFGTRLRGGAHPQRAHLFWHYAGNRFLTLLSNVLYNTTISDMEVGYKAFKGDLVRGLKLDLQRLPDRARADGEDPAHRPGAAPVRGADLLLRSLVRRRQEDHVA